MHWITLTLLTAFLESLRDLFSKRTLRTLHPYLVACSLNICTLPVISYAALRHPMPAVDGAFFAALISAALMHAFASLLYFKAIGASPLSLTLPMVAFTPLFMMITGPLMINELPSISGSVGIICIVLGTYVLNVKADSKGALAPLRSLWREPGPKMMLVVGFIWSITGNIDRIGVQHSSREFWIFTLVAAITLINFTIVACKLGLQCFNFGVPRGAQLLLCGALNGVAMLCYMKAITLTLVAYVVSCKRISILFGVIYGCVFFKEQHFRERLGGALIIFVGVILLTLL